MDVKTAQQIAGCVAKIAELATTFCATYGKDYRVSDDSPAHAWALYRQLMATQTQIASLLDSQALANPNIRWEHWWQKRDVINIGLVNELAMETIRLIERAAYLDALKQEQAVDRADEPSLLEANIAGLLHPAVRQRQLGHTGELLREGA